MAIIKFIKPKNCLDSIDRHGEMDLKSLRKIMGLKDYVQETVNCMKCLRKFLSYDKKRNRMCPNCKYDSADQTFNIKL